MILQEFLSGYLLRPYVAPDDWMQCHGNRVIMNALLTPFLCEVKLPLELSVIGIATEFGFFVVPIEPMSIRKFISSFGDSLHPKRLLRLYVDLSDRLVRSRIDKK